MEPGLESQLCEPRVLVLSHSDQLPSLEEAHPATPLFILFLPPTSLPYL